MSPQERKEAQALWGALADRFATCKLVLHPEKTKIALRATSTIDVGRRQGNLSSAIRLFVLGFYRDQIGSLRDQSSDHPVKARVQLSSLDG